MTAEHLVDQQHYEHAQPDTSKHGTDIKCKTVSVIAALLHVFNPAVYFLLGQMDLICEKYCDRAACEKGIDAFTRKEYFEIILELMISDGKKNRYQLPYSEPWKDPDQRSSIILLLPPTLPQRNQQGSGKLIQDFAIELKGRHYFFVSNLSETEDLLIEAVIVR